MEAVNDNPKQGKCEGDLDERGPEEEEELADKQILKGQSTGDEIWGALHTFRP